MKHQTEVPLQEYEISLSLIKDLELARINAYKQLSLIRLRNGEGYLNERLPKCKVATMEYEGELIVHLLYEGLLPRYVKGQHYTQEIRDYYMLSTLQAVEENSINVTFSSESIIWIKHHFSSNIIRDIDNRNRKYLIDAIRHARIIKDDSQQLISIFESSVKSERDFVELFIGDPLAMLSYISNDIKQVEKQNM